MHSRKPQSFKLYHSFRVAFRGLWWAGSERNVRVHVGLFLLVLLAGFYFSLSVTEWLAVVLVSGLVLVAEVLNTSIEELADLIRDTEHLPFAATTRVRDIAAGGVLVAAITAVIVGVIIFGPKVLTLLSL